MKNNELNKAKQAYERLIEVCDRARLMPDEIRGIAEAIEGLPIGESFSVTISTKKTTSYSKAVEVNYG